MGTVDRLITGGGLGHEIMWTTLFLLLVVLKFSLHLPTSLYQSSIVSSWVPIKELTSVILSIKGFSQPNSHLKSQLDFWFLFYLLALAYIFARNLTCLKKKFLRTLADEQNSLKWDAKFDYVSAHISIINQLNYCSKVALLIWATNRGSEEIKWLSI